MTEQDGGKLLESLLRGQMTEQYREKRWKALLRALRVRKRIDQIKRIRPIRFALEIPEAIFAAALILLVLMILYFFEKPEGFIHGQFPGLMLDIAVFGILIVVFNRLREKRLKIQSYRDEIEDYLGWKEPEASYRISGLIKRLNRFGVGDIELQEANLQGAYLPKANFRRASLMGVTNLLIIV